MCRSGIDSVSKEFLFQIYFVKRTSHAYLSGSVGRMRIRTVGYSNRFSIQDLVQGSAEDHMLRFIRRCLRMDVEKKDKGKKAGEVRPFLRSR